MFYLSMTRFCVALCTTTGYYYGRSSRTCYSVKSDTPLGWNDAKAACVAEGGDLASFGSELDHNFVKSMR